MGLLGSEEALALYAVTEAEVYAGWLARAERVQLTAVMAHHLPRIHRHMPTYDAEDVAAAFMEDRVNTLDAADAADRNIAERVVERRRGHAMGSGGDDAD